MACLGCKGERGPTFLDVNSGKSGEIGKAGNGMFRLGANSRGATMACSGREKVIGVQLSLVLLWEKNV